MKEPNLPLRPAVDADWPDIVTSDARAFVLSRPLVDEQLDEFRASVAETFVVRDTGSPGDPLVAISLYHRIPLTPPGAEPVDAAGLSWVAVAATHRRRGLLRRMITRNFQAWLAAGFPFAVLTASEGGIYERFGFGPACYAQRVRIDSATARLRGQRPARSPVRYGTPAQIADAVPRLHQRWAASRPGALTRLDPWWTTILADRDFRRERHISGLHYLLHPDGYAAYRTDGHNRTAILEDFAALTPEAHTELWRVLIELDLVGALTASLPVDEPLPYQLTDARAMSVEGVTDELWLSILDVPAALELRRYPADGEVLLDVADPFGEFDRSGRFLLSVEGGRARVRRTAEAPPGVATAGADISVLSSVYLGGVDPRRLAAAGRLHADPATADLLSRMFSAAQAPFAGTFF